MFDVALIQIQVEKLVTLSDTISVVGNSFIFPNTFAFVTQLTFGSALSGAPPSNFQPSFDISQNEIVGESTSLRLVSLAVPSGLALTACGSILLRGNAWGGHPRSKKYIPVCAIEHADKQACRQSYFRMLRL